MIGAYFLIFDPDTGVEFLGWRFLPRSETISWICVAITLAGYCSQFGRAS
jgi:hypothetical protein